MLIVVQKGACLDRGLDFSMSLLGKPLSMGPLSTAHYVSVLHRYVAVAHHIDVRHRYHLMRGAPNKGCAMHMWAPTSTIPGGVRPPHPWRTK
jgi:hypothetical protein